MVHYVLDMGASGNYFAMDLGVVEGIDNTVVDSIALGFDIVGKGADMEDGTALDSMVVDLLVVFEMILDNYNCSYNSDLDSYNLRMADCYSLEMEVGMWAVVVLVEQEELLDFALHEPHVYH